MAGVPPEAVGCACGMVGGPSAISNGRVSTPRPSEGQLTGTPTLGKSRRERDGRDRHVGIAYLTISDNQAVTLGSRERQKSGILA